MHNGYCAKWKCETGALKCVRKDGQPASDADCSSIGNKPTCASSGGGASGGDSTPGSSGPKVRIRVKCVSHAIVGMKLADMPFGKTSMTPQGGPDYTIRTNTHDIYHLDLPILNKGIPMPSNERPLIYKGDPIRANTSGPLENIIVYKEGNGFETNELIPDSLKLPEHTIPSDIQDGAIFELDIIECTPPPSEGSDSTCSHEYHSCIQNECLGVSEKQCKDTCYKLYCRKRGL